MRGFILFGVAAFLGGFGYWAFETWSDRKAERTLAQGLTKGLTEGLPAPVEGEAREIPRGVPPRTPEVLPSAGNSGAAGTAPKSSPEGTAEPAPKSFPEPALSARPIFMEQAAPSRESAPARASATVPSSPAPPAPAVEPAAALEEERRLARALFDQGEKERALRRIEEIYAATKDRSGVDLTSEVTKLLDAETRFERRREYAQYLARFDRGSRLFDDQLARALKKLTAADTEPEAAFQAWDDLSLAYDLCQDRTLKRKVMAHVEPFMARMVFSGRFTPILKSHTIKPGDSLTGIAVQFQTTVDALRRINSLKSDTIQPRQRLRILPGKVKVFVDKSDFVLWAKVDDRIFLEFPVGLGRDNATPTGSFVVRVRQKDPTWWRPGEPPIPPGDPRNILGTRWLGFKETQDFAGFGIHGTDNPGSLGKESSAGCIRLRNQDIDILFDFIPYGTEVVIQG